jgi:hypothetical protein
VYTVATYGILAAAAPGIGGGGGDDGDEPTTPPDARGREEEAEEAADDAAARKERDDTDDDDDGGAIGSEDEFVLPCLLAFFRFAVFCARCRSDMTDFFDSHTASDTRTRTPRFDQTKKIFPPAHTHTHTRTPILHRHWAGNMCAASDAEKNPAVIF